jgi:ferrous iron transport protein A
MSSEGEYFANIFQLDCKCEPFSYTAAMDAVAAPGGVSLEPGHISLSALSPGARGVVVSVGRSSQSLSPLDRRLLEFGFCTGEQVEILAEARPGRDPFVVRIGNTTLALRRCEAEHIWVDTTAPIAVSQLPWPSLNAPQGIDITAQPTKT